MPPLERIGLEIELRGSRLFFADINKSIQLNTLLAASLTKTAVASAASAATQVGVSRGFGVLNTAANSTNGALKNFGRSVIAATGFSNRFGVSLLFGAQALGVFSAALTISTAAKFQESLARIDNLTNLTRDSTEQLGKQILELTRIVPQTADDLGAAAYQILNSGISDVDLAFELLQVSAKAATGLFTDTETIAKILTSTLQAYAGSGLEAAEITDILTAAIREGRAEPQAFAEQLGNVIGLATNLGVTFDELSGSLAVLTNTGLPAAQAMTGIRGILNAINDPADSANEIFEKLGTSAKQLRQNIREGGLIAAFEDLAKRGGDNRQAIAEFFPEVRGLNAFLSGFTNNLSNTAAVFDRIRNASGATQNAFERASETFNNQAKLLRNELNIAMINLGNQILPTLNKGLQNLQGFLKRNREEISAIAQSVIQVGGQLGGAFITGIASIKELFALILGNKGTLIALGLIFASIAVAMFPIPIAIFTIIAAIGLLVKNWDLIKNKTIEVWGSIPDIIREPLEFIANDVFARGAAIVRNIIRAFENLLSLAKAIWAVLTLDFEKAWGHIKDVAKNVAESFVDTIVIAFGTLPNILISIAELAINGVIAAFESGGKKLRQAVIASIPGGPALAAAAELAGVDTEKDLGRVTLPRIPASSIPGISKAAADAIDSQADSTKKLTEEAEGGKIEFDRLKDTIKDETIVTKDAITAADALSDGIISFAEAAELGLDAIGAGALEATAVTREAEEEAFNFAKTLSKVANAFNVSTQAANKLILALAREALAKVQAAASELFGQPTKEVAQLNLDIANLQLKQAQVSERITPEIERLQDQLNDLNKIEPIDQGEEATTQTVAAVIQQGLQGGMGALNTAAGLTADELDNLKKNVQDKIEALERELELVNRDIGAIERRKAIYEAETNILQARLELENATLKTQAEQKTAAEELIVKMREASSAVVRFAKAAGEDVLESFNEMRKAMGLLNEAVALADDPALRKNFTPAVTAAALAANALAGAATNAATQLNGSAEATVKSSGVFGSFIDKIKEIAGIAVAAVPDDVVATSAREVFDPSIFGAGTPGLGFPVASPQLSETAIADAAAVLEQMQFGVTDTLGTNLREVLNTSRLETTNPKADELLNLIHLAILTEIKTIDDLLAEIRLRNSEVEKSQVQNILEGSTSRQHGGLITSPEIARLHPPELILPLNDATRSRELLQALPAHLRNIQQPSQLNGSLFGDIVVNGQSLEDNRRMVISEVNRRFDQQRRDHHRQGL